MKDSDDFIMMPVPRSSFVTVCALIGAGAVMHVSRGSTKPETVTPAPEAEKLTAPSPAAAPAAEQPSGGATAGDASADGVDAEGWPWSADMHAATKSKTKAGLWRMKVGVTRPDPKPGFAKVGASDDTGSAGGAASEHTGQPDPAPAPAAGEDEDEFAAFHAAAAENKPAPATARSYTDADLSALCNQAAKALNNPEPVKAVIAKFTPAGAVPHSRSIPADQRAAFVAEVEKAAGITFVG